MGYQRAISVRPRYFQNSGETTGRVMLTKVILAVGLVALSFWLSLHVMEYFHASPESRSFAIVTHGDATTSPAFFGKNTQFDFRGNGYAEVQNTKDLQCFQKDCSFSLAVTFVALQGGAQFIIGQSYLGQAGWHLLWNNGRLVMQIDGGANEIDAPLVAQPSRAYKIEVVRDKSGVRVLVDGVLGGSGTAMPFADLARDLTIGGRPGPAPMNFKGRITDVRFARFGRL